jgi:hypothetical protein
MPSLFPSIFTPGQFFKKNVASAQEVICEQYVLPSHLNDDDVAISRAAFGSAAGMISASRVGWRRSYWLYTCQPTTPMTKRKMSRFIQMQACQKL